MSGRLLYSTLFLLLSVTLVASNSRAELFKAALDESEWRFKGSPFLCELTHPVPRFGQIHFLAEAGESLKMSIESAWMKDFQGSLTFGITPAPWQLTQKPEIIGMKNFAEQNAPITHGVLRLLEKIQNGHWAELNIQRPDHPLWKVRLSGVGFSEAYLPFNRCRTQLLPANFDQLRFTTVLYRSGKSVLTREQRKELDKVIEYMKTDPRVVRVEVDGHSDRVGTALGNRKISRLRAERIRNYMQEEGIEESRIVLRFHGSRYPLNKGTTKELRAKNRRVELRLVRLQNPDS
ncbi:OmpA family protein [Endozoicomonas arenosclerae]|uniref:OmpA family protein n=1 Tax=Endozoicomonas arenosclerae TaxID=1633495 RepID=UPI00078145BD|nr:OmpA family protein [Endozoicomonas arenosclerae]